jgi:RND family efflux transporter MFP subunit
LTDSTAREPSRRWTWRLAVVLILAFGIGGFAALQVFKPRPAVRAPVRQLPLVRAAPVEIREGDLTVTGHGLVRPQIEVVLAPEVAGKVDFVSPKLRAGGAFRAGELLVRLDAEPFRAALAQARAERASAQASLALAEQLLQRTDELIARGFQTPQTRDERVANRDLARAALERAEALLTSRKIDLARSELRAPFAGRVLSEKVDAGESVQPGRELARLFADDVLEVAASLTDREVALLADPWRGKADGTAASVTIEHGGKRYRWPAQLDRVEAAIDSATRTLNVVVRIDKPQARGRPLDGGGNGAAPPLLVGMYAQVDIGGREVGRYAVLPRRALRDGDVVWQLDDAGKVKITAVRVLQQSDDAVAVGSPSLTAGARVVVSDLKVVTEGMAVRVVDEPSAAPAARRP